MKDVLTDKLTLISVNIATFSGYRRATRDHIKALGGSLPASAAITEGSIKVFPGDGTKELQTVRRSVFRNLQARGVRALGSQNVFAVLTTDLPEIEKEMADAQQEFIQKTADLDASYELVFEAHVAANPEAEAIIRSLKVDKAVALSKCRFSTDVFKIAPFVRPGQTVEEGIEGMVRGLGRQLYSEISLEMVKLLKNEAFEKQRVGQKTLRPIKAAIQKMQKLAFLDDSVNSAVLFTQTIMSTLPQEGYIIGQPFVTLEKLVETMADVDLFVNAAGKVQNGASACDVLFPPVLTAKVVAVPETVVEEVSPTLESIVQAEATTVAEVVSVASVVVSEKAQEVIPQSAAIPVIEVKPVVPAEKPPVVVLKERPVVQPAVPVAVASGVLKSRSVIKPGSLLF